VPDDHPARFLREFVDQLDLPALGFVMPSASEGRPPYAPSLLLRSGSMAIFIASVPPANWKWPAARIFRWSGWRV